MYLKGLSKINLRLSVRCSVGILILCASVPGAIKISRAERASVEAAQEALALAGAVACDCPQIAWRWKQDD